MAEIINLRLVRKARQRDIAAAKATESRARYGRSRSEREFAKLESERLNRLVDQARLDPE